MDTKTTSIRMALAVLMALPAAGLSAPNLSISDTLIDYQLYGKNWIRIEGDAETSMGGGVGSEDLVDITMPNVKINGNLSSGGRIQAVSNLDVNGNVNARGDFFVTDGNNSVTGSVNVGDTLKVMGGNPDGNEFGSPMHVMASPISIPGWAKNRWAGKWITGDVNAGSKGPAFTFGSNTAFPSNSVRFPDTTVNYDASRNCSTAPSVTFKMNMCGMGGSATDSILPPGRYGDFVLASGNTMYLTSGTYHFRSFDMLSDGSKLLFVQSAGSTTRMLVQNFFRVRDGIMLIAPLKYTDPTFAAGTVFIYCEGIITLSDDNHVWATVVGKNHVTIETGLRLFGQVFGDCLTIQNGFKGGTGFGKFLPMADAKPALKYSIIHFKHQD